MAAAAQKDRVVGRAAGSLALALGHLPVRDRRGQRLQGGLPWPRRCVHAVPSEGQRERAIFPFVTRVTREAAARFALLGDRLGLEHGCRKPVIVDVH